ncbi:hypothetical protein EYF80_046723 [Liparis tanakae]|uniref:Uncharacterized protein n=1 Tax=Liparis tanakae TaxID=230148 RepID=A0A4Z2FPM6_9TELE|nr:hypothetical protein EYF80_046723 [Liparis tanakae]
MCRVPRRNRNRSRSVYVGVGECSPPSLPVCAQRGSAVGGASRSDDRGDNAIGDTQQPEH